MRSFAGLLHIDGSAPDPTLLRRLGETIRLPASSAPVLEVERECGTATVLHREGGEASSLPRWDAARGELLCERDPFGVHPFYYAHTQRGLVFSDGLEAILAHPDVNADELDERAVGDYLARGVCGDERATIYANIRRLPPGHRLTWRRGEAIGMQRWWTLPAPRRERSRDAAARLEAALKDAIRDRVRSDAAVVFMSGGLDSTALAALTREARPETRLIAATSVYRARIADVEESYAVEAARSIGIGIRVFPLDDYPPLHSLEAGLWTAEPGPLLTASMTHDIYAACSEEAPVALHGHPADALLAPSFTKFLRGLPLARRATALVRYTLIRRRPPWFFLRELLGIPRREPPLPAPPAWLRAEAHDVARDNALASPMWSNFFEWAHPLQTRAAIEVAYPWSDPRVLDAALALEPIPWLVEKHIVRAMLRGRVSERIRGRKKSFLQGDPWTCALPAERELRIEAAARWIDPERFVRECRGAGSLSDATLRGVAFEYWLRELPSRVKALRNGASARSVL